MGELSIALEAAMRPHSKTAVIPTQEYEVMCCIDGKPMYDAVFIKWQMRWPTSPWITTPRGRLRSNIRMITLRRRLWTRIWMTMCGWVDKKSAHIRSWIFFYKKRTPRNDNRDRNTKTKMINTWWVVIKTGRAIIFSIIQKIKLIKLTKQFF